MKVILLQDVAKIGKKNSVVDVPDGYGMNKLVPKGLAKPATKANLKMIERLKQEQSVAQEEEQTAFQRLRDSLTDTVVAISAKANKDGSLYEAVKPASIVAGIEAATDLTMEAEWIAAHEPIKATGEHTITLTQGDDSFSVQLQVTSTS